MVIKSSQCCIKFFTLRWKSYIWTDSCLKFVLSVQSIINIDKTGTKRTEVLFFHFLRGGHQGRISHGIAVWTCYTLECARVTLACVTWQGFSVTFFFFSSLSWCLSFISQFVVFMFQFILLRHSF